MRARRAKKKKCPRILSSFGFDVICAFRTTPRSIVRQRKALRWHRFLFSILLFYRLRRWESGGLPISMHAWKVSPPISKQWGIIS